MCGDSRVSIMQFENENGKRGEERERRTRKNAMMGDKAQTPSGAGIAYHSRHRSFLSVRGDKPRVRGRQAIPFG